MNKDKTRHFDGMAHEEAVGGTVEWYTPPEIFEALGCRFTLDPASPGQVKVPWIPASRHYVKEDNGLLLPWHGRVWLNPPYGAGMSKWLYKMACHGNGLVLVFARTSTQWFHEYVNQADGVCFLSKKVYFLKEGVKKGNPGTGSIMLAFGQENVDILKKSGLGTMMITEDAHEQRLIELGL